MDESDVSMANWIKEHNIKIGEMKLIALFFGICKGIIPMAEYIIGHAVLSIIQKIISYLSLVILLSFGLRLIFSAIFLTYLCDSVSIYTLNIYTNETK